MSYTQMNTKYNNVADTVANKSLVVGKVDEDFGFNVIVGYLDSSLLTASNTTPVPILDKKGNPILIPKYCLVDHVTLKPQTTLLTGTLTGLQLGLTTRSSTTGLYGTQGTAIGSTATLATVNTGTVLTSTPVYNLSLIHI